MQRLPENKQIWEKNVVLFFCYFTLFFDYNDQSFPINRKSIFQKAKDMIIHIMTHECACEMGWKINIFYLQKCHYPVSKGTSYWLMNMSHSKAISDACLLQWTITVTLPRFLW